MSEGLKQLKHVLVAQTIDHDAQLAASVICHTSKLTTTYSLTQSGHITFECVHGTSEIDVRVAEDGSTFEIGEEDFISKDNENV